MNASDLCHDEAVNYTNVSGVKKLPQFQSHAKLEEVFHLISFSLFIWPSAFTADKHGCVENNAVFNVHYNTQDQVKQVNVLTILSPLHFAPLIPSGPDPATQITPHTGTATDQ